MPHLANLRDVEAALESFLPSHLQRYAYTTEHIEQFMDFLGNPQDRPKAIHVAGTSGKTSTAYYCAALLHQAGKKTGLLVSPHAERLNERVQINLEPLPEAQFCKDIESFLELVAKSGITLTYAEILYAFAYWEFAAHQVEYIVVEVGMGGLLDATNTMHRADKVCVITDIGLDHTNVLGDTLQQITQHKAGIIHLHNAVFCHRQETIIMAEIEHACQRAQADLHSVDTPGQGHTLLFLPLFQRRNFSLAAAAVAFVLKREGIRPLTTQQKLFAAHTNIPGRMKIIGWGDKVLVLDGAHNPQKMRALCESLADYFPAQSIAVLLGFTQGRGRILNDIVSELRPLAPHIIATSLQAGRHMHGYRADKIAAACRQVGLESVESIPDLSEAFQRLKHRPEPILLVSGSIHVMANIRMLLDSSS